MKYIWLAAALLAVLFTACEEDSPPPPPTPSMTILEAPTALIANADTCYTYRVQLVNTHADSIPVEVQSPDGSYRSTFALYDDGSSEPDLPTEYMCEPSGDIIPNDLIFTGRINARLLADSVTGVYEFAFRPPGLEAQFRTIEIQNVEPCFIVIASTVWDFDSCFAPVSTEVHIIRTEGDTVDSVRVLLIDPADQTSLASEDLSPINGDEDWSAVLTPNFIRCVPAGSLYQLRYHAKTRFAMECTMSVANVSVVNMLPVLSNVSMPDTINRPIQYGIYDTSYVTVRMTDCELAGDTSFVGLWFDVVRDDTLSWPPNHVPDFFLRDNGRNGDAVAGDEIYTVGLLTNRNDTLTNNVYYFRFYAVEGLVFDACNLPFDTSAYFYDSVRVIQPPGAFRKDKGERIKDEADFRVLN